MVLSNPEIRDELKEELKENLRTLKTLADETRLQLHLASMDAKDKWRELEPQILDIEQRVATVGIEASRKVVKEVTAKLEELRRNLR
jgi:hypothetical protein